MKRLLPTLLLLTVAGCGNDQTSTDVLTTAALKPTTNPTPSVEGTPRSRASAASRSRSGGSARTTNPVQVTATGSLNWHALAKCESSNQPTQTSATGKYRGLYQMDADFWRSYGGLEYALRPDLATPAEQTTVAARGYAARGRSPWPYCGRFL